LRKKIYNSQFFIINSRRLFYDKKQEKVIIKFINAKPNRFLKPIRFICQVLIYTINRMGVFYFFKLC